MNKSIPLFATIIFFLSGFSSLVYQVCWQRMLTLYYGSGAVSVVIIVSVFLLGLGCGALLLSKLPDRYSSSAVTYSLLEFVIGLFGISSVFLFQSIGVATAGSSFIASALIISSLLFIPTFCMGAGLPLLVSLIHQQSFLNRLSLLYFVNTLGASIACIATAYFFIEKYGLDGSIRIAAIINLLLALLVFLLFRKGNEVKPDEAVAPTKDTAKNMISFPMRRLAVVAFVSGFGAIACEILWFRVIGVLIKDSSYAFASMLSVYLLGIALGSMSIQYLFRKYEKLKQQKMKLFLMLQFVMGFSIALSFLFFSLLAEDGFLKQLIEVNATVAQWPSLDKTAGENVFYMLWPCMLFMFVPTLCMGALFPLMSELVFRNEKREMSAVSRPYFYNIIGNVCGSIITGFLLLPALHTVGTIRLVSLYPLLVVALLYAAVRHYKLGKWVIGYVIILSILFITVPENVVFYERMHRFAKAGDDPDFKLTESRDGVVATYSFQNRYKLFINGVGHGEYPVLNYVFRAMEAMAWAGKCDTVCIIGLGSGNTLAAVRANPHVKKIYIVELVDGLREHISSFQFPKEDLFDKRVEYILDDGRRFLLRHNGKMDVILMDPVRTTAAYSNNIYSREFFELCKNSLSKNGVLQCWHDNPQLIPPTFAAAFPNVKAGVDFLIGSPSAIANPQHEQLFNEQLAPFMNDAKSFLLQLKQQTHYINRDSIVKTEVINTDMKPQGEYYLY